MGEDLFAYRAETFFGSLSLIADLPPRILSLQHKERFKEGKREEDARQVVVDGHLRSHSPCIRLDKIFPGAPCRRRRHIIFSAQL